MLLIEIERRSADDQQQNLAAGVTLPGRRNNIFSLCLCALPPACDRDEEDTCWGAAWNPSAETRHKLDENSVWYLRKQMKTRDLKAGKRRHKMEMLPGR
jgi:hypothetical protein